MEKTDNCKLIVAIDAGTNNVKCLAYKTPGFEEVASYQKKIKQFSPKEGWLEQDPNEILEAVRLTTDVVLTLLSKLNYTSQDIAAIGITNQRESVVAWDKFSGKPLYNVIVWNDNRTSRTVDEILSKLNADNNYFKELSGLTISPLPSALKLHWLRNNSPPVRNAIRDGRCFAGNIDSWLVWNLTGGINGGLHITDVSNASRTLLMNLQTLLWEPVLLKTFSVELNMLPQIKSSSEIYGKVSDGSALDGVVISALLGNQQASMIGQMCFKVGQAKNTYRSGCFLLCNIGQKPVYSSHGLVTTVAYKFGNQPAVYALEGSIQVGGAAIKFLKNIGLMNDVKDSEELAQSVPTSANIVFVPAFRGLFAPYWRKDARGIICGLTAFATKNHIIRAALEAVCFQTSDIIEAMKKDATIQLHKLYVDGKMANNNLLMQLQADISGIPILKSQTPDTTALGCAMAAGQAKGINLIDLRPENRVYSVKIHHDTFLPTATQEDRKARIASWKKAVQRSYGWVVPKRQAVMTDDQFMLLSAIPFSVYLFSSMILLAMSEL